MGSIVGVKIYKAIPKYVDAKSLNEYVDRAWQDNGYDSLFTATDTDATEEDSSEDTESTDSETTSEDASSETESTTAQ